MTSQQQSSQATPLGAPAPYGRVILNEMPMTRLGPNNGREPLRAGVTAVYATANGTLEPLGRPLHLFEAAIKGYRTRYDVGVANHEHEFDIANELPSKEDVFRFYARVQFGFRVHDPAEVVRRRIQDGFQLARWRLLDRMRMISRKYTPEQCAEANDEMNRELGQRPVEYPEGLTVYRFAAFLSLDEQTQEALRRRRAAEHEIQIARTTHELDKLRAQNQHEIEEKRMEAVRGAMQGDHGLLMLHMARHPEDTERVLTMVANSRERSRADRIEMFKSLLDNNQIQGIELQEIRDENLRQILLAARADALEPLQVSAELGQPAPASRPAIDPPFSIPLPPGNGADGQP